VEVEVETTASLSGEEVRYLINEGPEVEVDRIRFVGVETFETGDLEKLMQIQESWFLDAKKFREEVFREDHVTLKTYYRSKGFFDVLSSTEVTANILCMADVEDKFDVIYDKGKSYTVRTRLGDIVFNRVDKLYMADFTDWISTMRTYAMVADPGTGMPTNDVRPVLRVRATLPSTISEVTTSSSNPGIRAERAGIQHADDFSDLWASVASHARIGRGQFTHPYTRINRLKYTIV
jgi:hypothetical protein